MATAISEEIFSMFHNYKARKNSNQIYIDFGQIMILKWFFFVRYASIQVELLFFAMENICRERNQVTNN